MSVCTMRSGAVICPASHDGFSVKCWFQAAIQGGALISAGFPCELTSGETIPTIVPHSGLEDLQVNGTTLCDGALWRHAGQWLVSSDRQNTPRRRRSPTAD
jgi:hypothetical protein